MCHVMYVKRTDTVAMDIFLKKDFPPKLKPLISCHVA